MKNSYDGFIRQRGFLPAMDTANSRVTGPELQAARLPATMRTGPQGQRKQDAVPQKQIAITQ